MTHQPIRHDDKLVDDEAMESACDAFLRALDTTIETCVRLNIPPSRGAAVVSCGMSFAVKMFSYEMAKKGMRERVRKTMIKAIDHGSAAEIATPKPEE